MYDSIVNKKAKSKKEDGECLKVTLNQIESGEDEVIINYLAMTREVEDVIRAAGGREEKIPCTSCVSCGSDAGGDSKYMVSVGCVLYAESVDRVTYIYTADGVYKTPCTLQHLELAYGGRGFFRCSKSMIINIYRISELRSESGGRINAAMENGEHVIISRKYAKSFRRELRGEE